MTVTEDRQKSVDFSDSYYTATQCIVVKKDSTITKLADLNGKKIGVQEGTTGDLLCTPGEDNEVITDSKTDVQRFKKGTAAADYLKDNALADEVGVFYQSDNDYSAGLYSAFTAECEKTGVTIKETQTTSPFSSKS